MAVHRIHKTKDYSVISNAHLRDAGLSLKTKGLLSMMLSLPDDWNYSRNGLVTLCKEGQAVIDSCLKELEQNGYLVRSRARNDKGQLTEVVYDIYETPQCKKPVLENPTLGNPTLENQTQLNTNKTNITNSNTNLLNKQSKEIIPPIAPQQFDEFWNAYPKKVGKKDALRAWGKVKIDFDSLMIALDRYKQSRKVKEGFVMNPATWLNGEHWDDENEIGELNKSMDALNQWMGRKK